ncbi:aldo/keto reductase [Paenibacillus puldeungensis]|uniref:Aldo/keto reductase n=1 Tax=Paenibacillus puldeungensis TaxID=696536 RepID=A0ABW3S1C9_9BACL
MLKGLQSTVTLNNGVKMPWLGLGVFKAEEGEEVVRTVKTAIRLGYRSIDTAAFYQNEEGVGKAVKEAMQENGVSREELFITTKVWNSDQGYDSTLRAFETSLGKLGLDFVDLYLVHWPVKGKYKDTWRALEKIYAEGKARAIGVSNFQIHHLEDLMADSKVVPTVNQVELHPQLSQQELRQYCDSKGIQVEAWSPLGHGKLLENEALRAIGEKYGKTAAQVILRWDLQERVITIPKSVNEQRIAQNADIFDFELTGEDMRIIDSLNQNKRFGADPDNFNF